MSGVIHIATDASFSKDPGPVIETVKAATLNILRSAKATPSVKSFVLTGSRIAVNQPWDPDQPCEIDTRLWHDEVVRRAWSTPSDDPQKGYYCYGASKVEGERAAWDFIKNENVRPQDFCFSFCTHTLFALLQPAFDFNVVLPDVVIGPVLNPPQDGELSRPAGKLNALFHGNPSVVMPFVESEVWYVDCRDVALLHALALLDSDVKNERILASAGPFPVNEVLGYFREAYPSRTFLPDFKDIKVAPLIVNNKRGTELIKRSGQTDWVPLRESALASVFP